MFEADNLEDVSFTINENYAKRFEHNKKREELHRCKYSWRESGQGVAGATQNKLIPTLKFLKSTDRRGLLDFF